MIEIWSDVRADRAEGLMPQELLARLGHHIRRHPWWTARARLIVRLIANELGPGPHSVLDVGCGWGVTLDHAERAGHRVAGMDIGHESLQRLAGPGRRLIQGDIETGPIPESARESFDVVLALDVLEHLDDDAQALRNLASLARPGGLVVVTVPAGPELWSEFDVVQGHRRRYTKQTLTDCFAHATDESGLDPARTRLGYCWPWMVPLARWSRRRAEGIPASGRSGSEIYERHVRPPMGPARWFMEAAFRMSEPFILAGGQSRGTSLAAWSRRRDRPSA